MNKSEKNSKKESYRRTIIDKSGESLKKIISKGKKQGFLKRSECERGSCRTKVLMIKKNFIQKLKV